VPQKDMTKIDFPYQVIRSRRKTAAIHVSSKGVQVRIPLKTSHRFALDFLMSKASWVRTKLAAQSEKLAEIPHLKIGSTLLWKGNNTPIYFQLGPKLKLSHTDVGFYIEASVEPTSEQLQKLFTQYFKSQAKEMLIKLTYQQADQMHLLHKLNGVRFRRTKTKWGHCTNKGVIQFNWLIMGAPINVIEYLVVHEVAHLKHPNHQADFWSFVKKYCENYKAEDKWLKENGIKLGWCD